MTLTLSPTPSISFASPFAISGLNRAHPLNRDVVAVWNPNWLPNGSVLYDMADGHADGVITGGELAADAERGHVLVHAANTDHVVIANKPELNPTEQITIAGWIKPTDLQGSHLPMLVSKNGVSQYMLIVETSFAGYFNNEIRLVIVANSTRRDAYCKGGLVDGVWQHIAATYNGAAAVIYVDGVAKAMTGGTFSGAIAISTEPAYIGRWAGFTNTSLFGSYGAVRIYPRALTADEIMQLYLLGLTGGGDLYEYDSIPLAAAGGGAAQYHRRRRA